MKEERNEGKEEEERKERIPSRVRRGRGRRRRESAPSFVLLPMYAQQAEAVSLDSDLSLSCKKSRTRELELPSAPSHHTCLSDTGIRSEAGTVIQALQCGMQASQMASSPTGRMPDVVLVIGMGKTHAPERIWGSVTGVRQHEVAKPVLTVPAFEFRAK